MFGDGQNFFSGGFADAGAAVECAVYRADGDSGQLGDFVDSGAFHGLECASAAKEFRLEVDESLTQGWKPCATQNLFKVSFAALPLLPRRRLVWVGLGGRIVTDSFFCLVPASYFSRSLHLLRSRKLRA